MAPHRRQEDAANRVRSVLKKKVIPWTIEEHKSFLRGLNKYGKGDWKNIARVVVTRTSIQVASHAQKHYLRLNNVNEKKRQSIHDITLESLNFDQHNREHPIQQLHEIHQPQEMSDLQSDNLVDFEDNFIVQHIDQHSWPPPKMQQLPHHIGTHDLPPLPYIQYLPHPMDLEKLIPPLDPQIQQSPYFIDCYNWIPTRNHQLSHYLDQKMLQELGLYSPNNMPPF